VKQLRLLENRGFVNRSGKGSHRNFTHPRVARPVTISDNDGDDAKKYQEKAIKAAKAEATR
jgi:predicted RNA binding protein YcfA (HicA-like mRNA interferase family)